MLNDSYGATTTPTFETLFQECFSWIIKMWKIELGLVIIYLMSCITSLMNWAEKMKHINEIEVNAESGYCGKW